MRQVPVSLRRPAALSQAIAEGASLSTVALLSRYKKQVENDRRSENPQRKTPPLTAQGSRWRGAARPARPSPAPSASPAGTGKLGIIRGVAGGACPEARGPGQTGVEAAPIQPS